MTIATSKKACLPERQRGFTLIEVVIALAIAALALTAATAAVSQMVDGANAMRERTYASWIAHNHIAELRLANQVPEVDTTTSDVTYADFEWSLETDITETGVENLFRVDVTVALSGSDYTIGTVTGFIGEPVPPGEANNAWSVGPESDGAVE